jgi:predicted Zn-dependent peptidase
LGFPIPPLTRTHAAFVVAAALIGEGMSSPLLDRLRERRGLVYHADCSADVRDVFGQFVLEASTPHEHLAEYFSEVRRLLQENLATTDRVGLARARNQIAVRTLGARESPAQRLELAALDLFALGRIRTSEELLAGFSAVTAAQVRRAFERMLATGPSVGMAGKVSKGDDERVAELLGVSTPDDNASHEGTPG